MLYPYRIELIHEVEVADFVISKGMCTDPTKPVIRVSATSGKGHDLEPVCYGNGIVDVSSDLLSRCSSKFRMALNPKISLAYILSTKLPLQYNKFPSAARRWILTMHRIDSDLSRHLATDIARKMLADAIQLLSFRLERKDSRSLQVTHDVDTGQGLRRAASLMHVEESLDIHSTFFLPSDEYPLDKTIVEDLSSWCEIGSHDVRHDGKLVHIQRQADLVRRLTESRSSLEQITGKEIKCFRAPLLQASGRILSALGEAGYRFDFSIPCWEPVYPLTMNGFGIESTQRFEIDGVVEVPLTLFQDHQVLHVLRMSTREAIHFWISQAEIVRSFDGDIVLLVHPDYSFSEDLQAYRELLRSLLEIEARPPDAGTHRS